MTRIVDPILADIRWEDGRATLCAEWHGVLIVCWILMAFEQQQATTWSRAVDVLGVYFSVWTPNVLLLLVATATLLTRRFLRPQPPSACPGA
jgi:hypothetical protein